MAPAFTSSLNHQRQHDSGWWMRLTGDDAECVAVVSLMLHTAHILQQFVVKKNCF